VTARKFDAFTLGFSNRAWDATIEILHAFGIVRLVDIRTLPGSRRTPQYNLDHLRTTLPESGIEYVHLKKLGGLRKPSKDSINLGWRNDAFRGYADYMQTAEFETALEHLSRLIDGQRTVFACTEAVFWRCHRQLVADALIVRGYSVGHILSATKAQPHELTEFAKVEGIRITYPGLLNGVTRDSSGPDSFKNKF
jgi:uncharacterized protein (DUF488 family)